MALPNSVHIANMLGKSRAAYQAEPNSWPRKLKQAKYLGGSSLALGGNLLVNYATNRIADRLSNKMINRKNTSPETQEDYYDPTDLTEIWATAAKIAVGGAKMAGTVLKSQGATIARQAGKVGGAFKTGGLKAAGSQALKAANARFRLSRIKMGALQRNKPFQAATLGFAKGAAATIAGGAVVGAVGNTINHKIQQKQEQRWEKQRQMTQQARYPYQTYAQEDIRESNNTFSPKDMGAARAAYKKSALANAHVANMRFGSKPFDIKKSQKLGSLKSPTKTNTRVSEDMREYATRIAEGLGTAMTIHAGSKIGFAPHRALISAAKSTTKAAQGKLSPSKIGASLAGR